MDQISSNVPLVFQLLAYLFLFAVGLGVFTLLLLYVRDKTQHESTLRRNYPVLARFRYLFEHLGEFFRQYFFAMDREEMPFNRAERSWVYRAAKDVDSTVAFGSSRDLRPAGTVYFANCAFPALDHHEAKPEPVTIGQSCRMPYTTSSIFNISAMSFGALSAPAVRALSMGAKKAGIWLNTGEGGLSPYHLEGGCDVIFQIGTAKFGVRNAEGKLDDERLKKIAAHENVRMFEIKMSQGAKPGKGGILPGAKVTPEIADIRGIPVGEAAISPNRHLEMNDVDDILDMVIHVREVTGKPVGLKMVVGGDEFLTDLFAAVKKRGAESAPDFITLDGGDGGTGAAPMSLIDNMGMPLRESLPTLVDCLNRFGLRDRVKVIASGKLINPSEVAWAFCAGADFVNTARGFMFALGCIQALQCNKNTCPTGVTTHDKRLQRGLVPESKADRVAHYAKNMTKEITIIAHSCGVSEPRALRRKHARIVMRPGQSKSMADLWPDVAEE
ncbi:MAG: FMN-binding glutamate synthase family protein [Alphaproteobacteria bacterium]|nr:FMN-binding glutamate synthase family protein [Alphaproteobacteria bacterium]